MPKSLPACQCRRPKRCRFHPSVGYIPLRRARPPPLVIFPGESPGKGIGQRSLADYSPWGHKELDPTEWLSTAQHRPFKPADPLGAIYLRRTASQEARKHTAYEYLHGCFGWKNKILKYFFNRSYMAHQKIEFCALIKIYSVFDDVERCSDHFANWKKIRKVKNPFLLNKLCECRYACKENREEYIPIAYGYW